MIVFAGCLVASACTARGEPIEPSSTAPSTTVDASVTSGGAGTVPVGAGGETDLEPLASFVAEAFGHDLLAIGAAVERARTEAMAACMTREGWEFSPAPPPPLDASSTDRVPLAEELLRELRDEAASSGSDDAEVADPRAYNEDLARCFREATEAVPDPAAEAFEWLDGETRDLYERVGADPRVVEAVDAERRCLAEAGYADPAVEEAALVDRAQEVVVEARAGAVDMAEAVSELEALAAQQRALWEAMDRCTQPRVQVERRVAAALEAEWLERNGDRLALVLAELEPAVAALTDELAAVEAGR